MGKSCNSCGVDLFDDNESNEYEGLCDNCAGEFDNEDEED